MDHIESWPNRVKMDLVRAVRRYLETSEMKLVRVSICMRALLAAGLALVAVVIAPPAQAAGAPGHYVTMVGRQTLAIARRKLNPGQRVSQYRTLLRRHVSVRTVALFSLGRYRRKLPAGKRGRYYRLIETFIARFMARYNNVFTGQKLKILRITRRSSRDIIVDSQILYGGGRRPSPVDWRLIRMGGGFRVFDIKVQGIWLAILMRSRFVTVLRQNNGDFGALFAHLGK